MGRFSVYTGTVLLGVLAWAAPLRAEDTDGDQPAPARKSWFGRLRGGPDRTSTAKQDLSPEMSAAQKRMLAIGAARALKARELNDWTRRVAVCDRLREIANLTNDAELRRKADQLDQRAFELYRSKTDSLVGGPAGLQADERILERRLGTGAGTGQALLPAVGRSDAGQASIREVQP